MVVPWELAEQFYDLDFLAVQLRDDLRTPVFLDAIELLLHVDQIFRNHRCTPAPLPAIRRSTSAKVAKLLSPAVVIASAPCAMPHCRA